MERVSTVFEESIYAPSRQTTAKVIFEMVDVGAYGDAFVTALTSEAAISRVKQVVDRKREISRKYATFEPDYFILDGSMSIPPKPNEGTFELGFWSEDICDETGTFPYVTQPAVQITFSEPRSSVGLTITFDTAANEYASIFTVLVYAAGDNLIRADRIVKNTDVIYLYEKNLSNYVKIEILVEKWTKGNRRARIVEVDFGLIQEYTGKELINLNVIEEVDLIGSTVPSNELSFTLDNQSRVFDILNPQGIYAFISPKQQVRAYIGLKIGEGENDYEFVSVGKYYLTEWQNNEGALTTTFTAHDIFNILETIEYNDVMPNDTLYNLAVDILIRAEIDDYWIDDRLKSVSTNGFSEPISSRVALQNVAIAGRAVIYQDRQGTLIIKRIEPLTTSTGYITFPSPDTFAGLLTTPEITNNYEFQAINFENTFAEPQVKLNEVIKSLVFLINDATEEGTQATFLNSLTVTDGISYRIENPLINTVAQAELVAEWMFEEYNMRAHYTANWRQNPALSCSDTIMIENSFGEERKSRITRQDMKFEGFLTGTTESVGGV